MTEVAIREHNTPAAQVSAQRLPQPAYEVAVQASPLARWVEEAARAEELAKRLASTSFVPASMRGKPVEVMAAILAGIELGFQPMAALRSMDVIQGTPALRAHAMRGLVQSHGHEIELVGEATAEKAVMRGRRKGSQKWQQVTWDIPRAAKMGLTGKAEWKRQPQTMLVARATGEMCRLIASDVIHAMPYAAEELDGDTLPDGRAFAEPRVTVDEVMSQASAPEAPAVEPPTVEYFRTLAADAETVDDLTDALRSARTAGFAQDGDELYGYFIERRTALVAKPAEQAAPSGTCGYCMEPGHLEDDCPSRVGDEYEYAQHAEAGAS